MKAKLFSDHKPPRSPLDYAIQERDSGIMQEVENALANKRVLLAYQPVMSTTRPGQAVFWEGLARLRDAQGRILPAGEFMAAVEPHEIGRSIDCAALELGLAELHAYPSLRLSINLSARSIGYPRWMQVLDRGLALDPTVGERLILEITESSTLVCGPQVLRFMANVHSKGISFALDDFGAGYTSLKQLRDFTFDILKIDGSYVRGIDKDDEAQILMEAIVGIARKFDMLCVAEKVENEVEAKYLSKIGVDCLQGYHFAAPTVHPQWRNEPARKRMA
jgi:EAL domain-containing protein (putative c-di-GMP-specific phosphodiesterase class I)